MSEDRPITNESLDRLISRYVQKGYKVVSRTPSAAQLVREKKFSCLIATVTFLFFAIPFFIYLFWYMSKREDSVYLEIVEDSGSWMIKVTPKNGRSKYYKKDPTASSPPGIERLPKWIQAAMIIIIVVFFSLIIIGLSVSQ